MEEWSEEKLMEMIEASDMICVYFYTPLCGTCNVSEKMLSVIQELQPQQIIGKININYVPKLAEKWMIESVPCLLIFKNSKIFDRIYAFHHVVYLYNRIQNLEKNIFK